MARAPRVKCPHCNGTDFALSTEQLTGAKFPLSIVRCSSCDAPFGVLQMEDPNMTIRQEAAQLAASISSIGAGVAKDLAELLRRVPAKP
jgi:predicted Zn finger-like uncharacterized protein